MPVRAKSSVEKVGIEADVPACAPAFAVFLALSARGPLVTSASDPAISRVGIMYEISSFTTTSLSSRTPSSAHRTQEWRALRQNAQFSLIDSVTQPVRRLG